MLGLEVIVPCLLFGALAHCQTTQCGGKNECPIDVYFTIDTSETIALQEPPPGSLVESIKKFTEEFVLKLEDDEFRGAVKINWNIGGLHFSQQQKVFSAIGPKNNFITSLRGISYLGKGTYIDCALTSMTQEMKNSPSRPGALRFAVVITDGHETGELCGGIKVAAERAREDRIRIFVVAASKNVEETNLKEIANSPATVYRRDFMAVDLSQGRAIIQTDTIDRIIKTMKQLAYVECYNVSCLNTQGSSGPTGHRGQKGAKGDNGDPGQKGERGRPGDPGIGAIRQGSIGVWKFISPRLAGIGYSSCVVCFFVALYYNVILAWSFFYLGNSFQHPLPWIQCPEQGNVTVKECEKSSPTSYFWYRKALDITDSIDDTGSFNPYITCCLLAAWTIVCLGMFKGIKSSVKVMYFSSIFPYVVLFCFLVRGLMLDGASEGIRYMFYPKLEIWGDVQVWRQAATQVFFALGLGFGSIIAYSSYNPRNNNCHRDAFTVSSINFLTSVLATLVVFAVLGFRAKGNVMECVVSNVKELSEQFHNSHVDVSRMPSFNYSVPQSVSLEDYRTWFKQHGANFSGNLTDCDLEKEMQKGVEGTGLAFIAFTEAMSLLPGSPFWSALFFLMLLNLGLSTMFGTMEGILAPLTDRFKTLANNKTKFTIISCIIGFVIGLLFTQRSGNYFVMMFDDYSATLPLIIVVVFETFSVSWLYGADRFLDDIEVMLGWRPSVIYKYLWKYICLLAMLGLLGATGIRMVITRPTYMAWNQEKASEEHLPYPDWALAVLALLIIFAMMPVPVALIHALLQERTKRISREAENGQYSIVSTDDKFETAMTDMTDLDQRNGTADSFS